MRVGHWLFGCAVCFAGIGTAAATSVSGRDLDGSSHNRSDSSSTADGGNAGDPLRPSRDSSQRGVTTESSTGSSHGTAGDPPAAESSRSSHVPQQPHLGWQSLLPGSIQ